MTNDKTSSEKISSTGTEKSSASVETSKDAGNSNYSQEAITAAQSPAASGTVDKSQPAPKKSARHHKKRHVPWMLIFALILIAGLAAGNYWQYQQGQQLIAKVDQLNDQQSALDNQVSNLNSGVATIQDQQKSLETQADQNENVQRTLRNTLDQMSDELKSLATTKGKAPLYWRVSEVEYLLTIANHRLRLERDVQTAKIALQDADTRLRAIADPGLIPVREKISQEINQLDSVSLPDIPGMAAKLNSAIDGISNLPFSQKNLALESEPVVESEKEYKGIGNIFTTVWKDLVDGLFKVQRTDQPIEPLLPPEEKLYLAYNLELKLEQARLTLFNQETDLFRTNLEDIEEWVGNYFDQESAPVINLLQSVAELKKIDLRPSMPDISASLRELRSWMETQQQKNVAFGGSTLQPMLLVRFSDEAMNP